MRVCLSSLLIFFCCSVALRPYSIKLLPHTTLAMSSRCALLIMMEEFWISDTWTQRGWPLLFYTLQWQQVKWISWSGREVERDSCVPFEADFMDNGLYFIHPRCLWTLFYNFPDTLVKQRACARALRVNTFVFAEHWYNIEPLNMSVGPYSLNGLSWSNENSISYLPLISFDMWTKHLCSILRLRFLCSASFHVCNHKWRHRHVRGLRNRCTPAGYDPVHWRRLFEVRRWQYRFSCRLRILCRSLSIWHSRVYVHASLQTSTRN